MVSTTAGGRKLKSAASRPGATHAHFNSILCQEDSNLLAQDRGVLDCHRSLENDVDLGRLPGELNHAAELNCAHEPARWAGRHEPRLQTLCKQLQRRNRRTCDGAAKGSRAGWYRR